MDRLYFLESSFLINILKRLHKISPLILYNIKVIYMLMVAKLESLIIQHINVTTNAITIQM